MLCLKSQPRAKSETHLQELNMQVIRKGFKNKLTCNFSHAENINLINPYKVKCTCKNVHEKVVLIPPLRQTTNTTSYNRYRNEHNNPEKY